MTTVLVVDDDPVMREIMRALLGVAGYEVAVAADGAEGLDRLAEVRPDAIMVDSQMPGIGGLEVIRRIRAGGPTDDLAVVLMSGESSEAEVAAGLDAGADRYLVKPFAPGDVFAALDEALRARPAGGRSG